MFILVIRNPDPLINPIIFAEDGVWTGIGLTKGWLFAYFNARPDYFVFLNIMFLHISTLLSYLWSDNYINLLPETIAISSFFFFSAVATLAFVATKKSGTPVFYRLILYLIILLIPLGTTQNQIFGRILQIGFYIPFIAIFLFYLRDNNLSNSRKYIIDFMLLLCAATNPVTISYAFMYVLWNSYSSKGMKTYIINNLSLIIPLLILTAIIVPRLGGHGGIPGEFQFSNFIETIIARPILYPFIFPWYEKLTDEVSIFLFFVWIFFIAISYRSSNKPESKKLIIYLSIAFVIYDIATITMRPGLTEILSNYEKTFPDRYFMGLNVIIVALTIISLSQLCLSKKRQYQIFSHFIMSVIVFIFLFNTSHIFEVDKSRLPIKNKFDFREQICVSQLNVNDFKSYSVNIYPSLWRMNVPRQLVDKSSCITTEDPFSKTMEYINSKSIQLIKTPPTQYHNVKNISKNRFQVLGNDPYIVFNIDGYNISGREVDLITFELTCDINNASIPLEMFWSADNYSFNEMSVVRFHVNNGLVYVPLHTTQSWLDAMHIKKIRIDIRNKNSCKYFSIENITLSQRVPINE